MAKKKRVRKVGRQQAGGVYRPRVIVKFHDHVQLPHDRTAGARLAAIEPGGWGRLTQSTAESRLPPCSPPRRRSPSRHWWNGRARPIPRIARRTFRRTSPLTCLGAPVGRRSQAKCVPGRRWRRRTLSRRRCPHRSRRLTIRGARIRATSIRRPTASMPSTRGRLPAGRRRTGARRPRMGLDAEP